MRPTTLRAGETGTSLVEVLMVAAVLAIVTPVILGSLLSTTRATDAMTDRSVAVTAARTALEAISRDVRAGDPIDILTPVSMYDTQLGFTTYCVPAGSGSCDASNRRHVSYRVDDHSLYRVVGTGGAATATILVGPSGPSSLPEAEQRGALRRNSSVPVFRFFDKRGDLLSTSTSGGAPSTSFRDCARSVEIRLRIIAEPGTSAGASDIATKVDLRNFHEVTGC